MHFRWFWFWAILGCLLAGSCRNNPQGVDRRAQLVGQENLQLKKQIQEKDREIERLKGEIQKLQKQSEQEAELQGQTYTKLMEIMADLTAQLEACKAAQPLSEKTDQP